MRTARLKRISHVCLVALAAQFLVLSVSAVSERSENVRIEAIDSGTGKKVAVSVVPSEVEFSSIEWSQSSDRSVTIEPEAFPLSFYVVSQGYQAEQVTVHSATSLVVKLSPTRSSHVGDWSMRCQELLVHAFSGETIDYAFLEDVLLSDSYVEQFMDEYPNDPQRALRRFDLWRRQVAIKLAEVQEDKSVSLLAKYYYDHPPAEPPSQADKQVRIALLRLLQVNSAISVETEVLDAESLDLDARVSIGGNLAGGVYHSRLRKFTLSGREIWIPMSLERVTTR